MRGGRGENLSYGQWTLDTVPCVNLTDLVQVIIYPRPGMFNLV